MRALNRVRLRLRSLFRRGSVDAELDAELQFHLDQLIAENVSRGASPEEARRLALRRMGSMTQLGEECRDARRLHLIDNLWRDFRYAVRVLERSPGFTAVAVVTIALGVGANTAVFSVVNSVLLNPLAYADADRIVAVETLWTDSGGVSRVSGGDYSDVVADPSPFAAVSRYVGGQTPVETGGRAEFAAAFAVDAGFADAFQLQPVAGRLMTADEVQVKAQVAVVSEGFALARFGAAERAVGRSVRMHGGSFEIVGVAPGEFRFPGKADLWFPMQWENPSRTAHNYRVVARLGPGASLESARARLAAVGEGLQRQFPSTHATKSFTATPLREVLVQGSRTTLWLLMGATGLLLLVACANVANLMLARSTARSREMALRAALGAGRRRLAAQLLVESGLLGLAGGAIGLALAYGGVEALLALAPADLPRLDEIGVDSRALAFNLVASLAAAVGFGLWPAWRAARVDPQETLKRGGARGVLGMSGGDWARGALVSAEVATALVLALGAGLLFRSLLVLNAVDLGYETEGRLALTASIPAQTEEQHHEATATFQRVFTALEALPGVNRAAGVMGLPNGPYGSNGAYAVEGLHEMDDWSGDMPHAGFRITSPGYFEAMGTPVLAGRDFDAGDVFEAEPVAIVSAALAQQMFPDESPLGRRIKCGLDRDVWMRVVGVVGDMRNEDPATPAGPEIYMPYRQHPYFANDLHIVVRARGDVTRAAVAAIAGVDPGIPVKVGTLEQFRSDALALPRFRTVLLIVVAGLAALLAVAGVYGVMSYVAAQRRSEMGVRLALGATGGDIVGTMVGGGAKLTAAGLAVGLGVALGTGRLAESMLYGVEPQDPYAVGGAVLLLSLAALVATLGPALRAASADPAAALRAE